MHLKKLLGPKLLVAVWLIAAGCGSWIFAARSFSPGNAGTPASDWPADTKAPRNTNGYTLVVALHPECGCSQATLENLEELLTASKGRLRADVLCVEYPELDESARESDNWKLADRIKGVSLTLDSNAAEAKLFAARTSGESRLYGPDGRLLFRGGITSGRGHAGENPGSTAVLNLINGRNQGGASTVGSVAASASAPITTPVFGCSL